jgi:hypothetical protein
VTLHNTDLTTEDENVVYRIREQVYERGVVVIKLNVIQLVNGNGFNTIFFLNLQILVNAFNNGEMKITDIDLLIMDECHHTNLKHPYNAIMAAYHEVYQVDRSAPLPQIIGLTASLGVGDSDNEPLLHYIKICANLNCDRITHVKAGTEFMDELLRHSPRPKADQIISVRPCNPNAPFVVNVSDMMQNIEQRELSGNGVLVARGTQPYENTVITVSYH